MADADIFNAELGEAYLEDKFNPRWVAKPAVAYLWARTVTCKNCRATIPLLKTRWLCKKDNKRIRLLMEPNLDAHRRGSSPSSTTCLSVAETRRKNVSTTKNLVRARCLKRGLSASAVRRSWRRKTFVMKGETDSWARRPTAVVVEGPNGKEYRLPTQHETRDCQSPGRTIMHQAFDKVPFGLPRDEPTPRCGRRALHVPSQLITMGLTLWCTLFTKRQLVA